MIKETLFTGWNWVRWLRLGLGIAIAFQAIETHDALAGVLSAFLLFQAISNTGCCGVNACDVKPNTKRHEQIDDVVLEEIKIK
jgi:hypothetical protein